MGGRLDVVLASWDATSQEGVSKIVSLECTTAALVAMLPAMVESNYTQTICMNKVIKDVKLSVLGLESNQVLRRENVRIRNVVSLHP